MTYKRLSESEKQEIIRLFQKGQESIASLTERFGVSSSTIRRAVKGILPESEPEGATPPEQKGGSSGTVVELQTVLEVPATPAVAPVATMPASRPELVSPHRPPQPPVPRSTATTAPATPFAVPLSQPGQNQNRRTTRRRSSAAPPGFAPSPLPLATAESEPQSKDLLDEYLPTRKPDPETKPSQDLVAELATLEDEDLDEDDLDDLDDLDGEFEDDEGSDTEEGDLSLFVATQIQPEMLVQVQPIATAQLPKTCYLVIDRASELITRPLRDFGDLGAFPETETQQRTLPVFDNHRVAKRFSNPRTQRVVKLPDAKMLQNTSSHLHAKGITRLLIDGRVYSL